MTRESGLLWVIVVELAVIIGLLVGVWDAVSRGRRR